jgi:uncharacterized protein
VKTQPQPSRKPDPANQAAKLDVAALAAQGQTLAGEWLLSALPRLCESLVHEASVSAEPPAAQHGASCVRWDASGSLRRPLGGEAGPHLQLRAHAVLPLRCQRCLEPVFHPVQVDRGFFFVSDEATAERLDEGNDQDDMLVLTRHLDLRDLLEDELILALPLVPLHSDCVAPGSRRSAETPRPMPGEEPAVHPFAALAALRRP